MRLKNTLYIGSGIIGAAIIIATASSVFHKPIPKAEPIPACTVRLNKTLTNEDNANISDGYFHESEAISAPAFDLRIDGITLLNEKY